MKTVAIIPARGGSKGIPGKNIIAVAGKALLLHSVDYALSSELIDDVYVSTDSDAIAAVAEQGGARVIRRPENIAGDTATTESAVAHALHSLDSMGVEADRILLLQATSPFRPEGSLDRILQHFSSGQFDSLLTLSPTHRFFWRLQGQTASAEYDYMNRPRRQDMKAEDIRYVENGSLYLFTSEHWKRTGNRLGGRIGYYVFEEKYSAEIDSPEDLRYIEELMKAAALESR